MLDFSVIPATKSMKTDLFLNDGDFVYKIRRLRLLDEEPIMIGTGYIPLKSRQNYPRPLWKNQFLNYLEDAKGQQVTRSYMSIQVAPSNQRGPKITRVNCVTNRSALCPEFFMDDGTPFEISICEFITGIWITARLYQ